MSLPVRTPVLPAAPPAPHAWAFWKLTHGSLPLSTNVLLLSRAQSHLQPRRPGAEDREDHKDTSSLTFDL